MRGILRSWAAIQRPMNRWKAWLVGGIGSMMTMPLQAQPSYCVPTYTYACDQSYMAVYEWRVWDTAIVYNSGVTGCDNPSSTNYVFRQSDTIVLVKGRKYHVKVRGADPYGPPWPYYALWIDDEGDGWDGADGDFIARSGSASEIWEVDFRAPLGNGLATYDTGRLRIRVAYGGGALTSADTCSHRENGETEDYVVVLVPADTSVGVSEVTAPPEEACSRGTESVAFIITNYGPLVPAGTAIPYQVALDGSVVCTDTFVLSADLPFDSSVVVAAPSACDVDLSDTGWHEVAVWTGFDSYRGDDTAVRWVYHLPRPALGPDDIFVDDFECLDAQEVRTNGTVLWAGNPPSRWIFTTDHADGRLQTAFTNRVPSASEGGDRALTFDDAVDGNNTIHSGAILRLDLSAYDTGGAEDVMLQFYVRGHRGGAPDSLDWLAVRGDSSQPWIALVYYWDPPHLGWWAQDYFNISSALRNHGQNFSSQVEILFSHEVSGSVPYDGFSIDGVRVWREPPDLHVREITAPTSGCGLSNSEPVSFTLRNEGQEVAAGTAIPYTVALNNTVVCTETYVVGSDFGYNEEVTVNAPASCNVNVGAVGTYDLKVWISWSPDTDPSNDTATRTVQHKTPAAPLQPNEIFGDDFECLDAMTVTTSGTSMTSGTPMSTWTYYKTNNGRLQTHYTNFSPSNGDRAVTLDATCCQWSFNEMVLELDMSAYDTASDFFLMTFALANEYYEDKEADDAVWVRGSSADPWVKVEELDVRTWDTSWRSQEVEFTTALKRGGQNYSSTFQVRFSQVGSSFVPNEGISIDQVRIRKAYDTWVKAIHKPISKCSMGANEPVEFTIAHRGLTRPAGTVIGYTVWLDDSVVCTDSVVLSSPFTNGDTLRINTPLTCWVDLSDYNSHVVKVQITQGPDEADPSNQQLTRTVYPLGGVLDSNDIFRDNFECLSDTVWDAPASFQSGSPPVTWNYDDGANSNGLLQTAFTNFHPSGGARAATVGRDPNAPPFPTSYDNKLSFSLNTGPYAGDTLQMMFWVTDYGDDDQAGEGLWVRSSGTPWIQALDFDPTRWPDGQWQFQYVNLTKTFTSHGYSVGSFIEFEFRQEGSAMGAARMSFDHIVVQRFEGDLGVVEITEPEARYCGGPSQSVRFVIVNYGTPVDAGTSIPYRVAVDGNVQCTGSYSLPSLMLPGDSVEISVGCGINLGAPASHEVKVWLEWAFDRNPANDTLSKTVEPKPGLLGLADVFVDNFECLPATTVTTSGASFTSGTPWGATWTYTNTSNGRLRTAVENHVPSGGNRSATLDVYPWTSSGADNWWTLEVDLSAYDTARELLQLRFWITDHGDNTDPGDSVAIRGSNTDPWIHLMNLDPGAWVDFRWRELIIDIASALRNAGQNYSGTFQVRFAQHGTDPGFSIDGIRIEKQPAELAVTAVEYPISHCGLDSSEPVRFTIFNSGTYLPAGTDIPYTIEFDGTVVCDASTPLPADLEVDQSVTLTADPSCVLDMRNEATYTVRVWVRWPDDPDRSNDTAGRLVVHRSPTPLGTGDVFVDNFECVDSMVTYASNVWLLSGNPSADWYIENPERRGFYTAYTNYAPDTGRRAFSVEGGGGAGGPARRMRLVIDLSAYDTANDALAFAVFARGHGRTNLEGGNTLRIRQNSSADWITLQDEWPFSALSWRPFEYNMVRALKRAGQNYSGQFEVEIAVRRHPSHVSFDSIRIYRIPYEVEVASVDEPFLACGLPQYDVPVTFTIANYGEPVDSGTVIPYVILWNDTVRCADSVVITSRWPVGTSYTVHTPARCHLDLTTPGDGELTVRLDVVDWDTANNTFTHTVRQVDASAPLPRDVFADDLECLEAIYTRSNGYRMWSGIPLSRWTFETDHPEGRLRTYYTNYWPADGSRAFTLDDAVGWNNLTHPSVTLEVDLSAYDTATDALMLSVYAHSHNDYVDSLDWIGIRSDTSQPWIALTWWWDPPESGWGRFVYDLTSALRSGGQNFSGTFQIRFAQQGGAPTEHDGISIDDIRIFRLLQQNVGIASIDSPQSDCYLDSAEQVLFTLINYGRTVPAGTVIPYSVALNGSVMCTDSVVLSSPLDMDQTLQVAAPCTVDLQGVGTYRLEVWTNWSADTFRADDTAAVEVEHRALPALGADGVFFDDFECLDALTTQSSGYQMWSGNPRSRWTFENDHPEGRLRTDYTNYWPSGGARAFTLDDAVGWNNVTHPSVTLEVDLSAYDTATDDLLLSVYAYSHNDYVDSLDWIGIRSDTSQPWIALTWWWDPPESGWGRFVYDLTSALRSGGQNFSGTFQIRFAQQGGAPAEHDGISIDAVRIYHGPSDVGVASIDGPASDCYLDSAEQVTFTLVNHGAAVQAGTAIPYEVAVDGSVVCSDSVVIAAPWKVSETLQVTAPCPVDMRTPGTYRLAVWTVWGPDADRGNDTAVAHITHRTTWEPGPGDIFVDDLECLDALTTQSNGHQMWSGVPRSRWTFESDHSEGRLRTDYTNYWPADGSRAFTLDDAVGGNNITHPSVTLEVDLSAYDTATDAVVLSFYAHSHNDYVDSLDWIGIRSDASQPWIALTWWWDPPESGWGRFEYDLTSALRSGGQNFSGTFQIRFTQQGGEPVEGDGISIDGIRLFFVEHDIAVTAIDSPLSQCELDSNEAVVFTFKNRGQRIDSGQAIPYAVAVNDSVVCADSVVLAAAWPPQVERQVTAPAHCRLDLSGPIAYEVRVTVSWPGDQVPANDTLVKTVHRRAGFLSAHQVFIDNFECLPDITLTISDTFLSGTPIATWIYEPFGDARLQTAYHNFRPDDGQRAITLDDYSWGAIVGSNSVNHFTLEIDLSAYDTATDTLQLTFWITDYRDNDHSGDGVWIRQDTSMPWIQALHFDVENWTDSAWRGLIVDLRETLAGAGQNFGPNFQIRFSQEGTQPVPSDGITIDEVIIERTEADLRWWRITSPQTGYCGTGADQTVAFSVINEGCALPAGTVIPYAVAINGNTVCWAADTLADPLFPGDTLDITAPAACNVDLRGGYVDTLTVWGRWTADRRRSNDTVETYLQHQAGILAANEVFVDDIECAPSIMTLYPVRFTSGMPAAQWEYRPEIGMGHFGTDYGGPYNYVPSNGRKSFVLDMWTRFSPLMMTMTLDLSAYDTAFDVLEVEFWSKYYPRAPVTAPPVDSVAVRGDTLSRWVWAANWGEQVGVAEQWRRVRVDLTQPLRRAGQNFGTSFQLRLSQEPTPNYSMVHDGFRVVRVVNEVEVEAVDSPVSACGLDSHETVVFTWKNNGSVIDSGTWIPYAVELNGNRVCTDSVMLTADWLPYRSQQITASPACALDLQAEGQYEIAVISLLPDDPRRSNDTARRTVFHATPAQRGPYDLFVDNFECIEGRTWTQSGAAFTSGQPPAQWQYTKTAQGRLQTSYTNYAPTGGRAAATFDAYPWGTSQNHLTLQFDLDTFDADIHSVWMSVWLIDHDDDSEGGDSIAVRGDSTAPWIRVELLDPDAYPNNKWRLHSIFLSEVLQNAGQNFGSSFQWRISQRGGAPTPNDGISIDSVRIYRMPREVAVLQLDSPASGCGPLGASTLRFTILNRGDRLNAGDAIPYQVAVNHTVVCTDSVTLPRAVPPSGQITLTSAPCALNLAAPGNYRVRLWTMLPGDQNPANDTAERTLRRWPMPARGPFDVFVDNIECVDSIVTQTQGTVLWSGNPTSRWTFGGDHPECRLQTAYTNYAPANGSRAFTLDDAVIWNNITHPFITLEVDLSGYDTATDELGLSFFAHSHDDYLDSLDWIGIRSDTSQPWIPLTWWWDPPEVGWSEFTYNLSEALRNGGQNFSGAFQIRFTQQGGAPVEDDGISIDSVRIYVIHDLEVVSIEAPLGGCTYDSVEPVQFTVANLSSRLDSGIAIPYAVELNGGTVCTDSLLLSTPFLAGDTLSITASCSVDLRTPNTYHLRVWIGFPGDENPANDTAERTFDRFPAPELGPHDVFVDHIECVDSIVTQVQGTVLWSGNPPARWTFGGDHPECRLQTAYTNYAPVNGRRAFTLDDAVIWNNITHPFITLEVDLSGYDTAAHDLVLTFFAHSHDDYLDSLDWIGVRSDTSQPWIPLTWWWDPPEVGWGQFTYNLGKALRQGGQNYSGTFQIRFTQQGGAPVEDDGISIDSVRIFQGYDVEVVAVDSPRSACELTAAANVVFRLVNHASTWDSGMQMPYTVALNGAVVCRDTLVLAAPWPRNDTLTVTAPPACAVDLSTPGTYEVKVWTTVPGDLRPDDDSAGRRLQRTPAPALGPDDVFVDNIECVDSIVTQVQGTVLWSGNPTSRWTFGGDHPECRLQTAYTNYAPANGSRAFTLDDAVIWNNITHPFITLEVDLSGYDTATDELGLSFFAHSHDDYLDSLDWIGVRSDTSQPWIALTWWWDPPEVGWSEFTYNLSEALRNGGQNFSGTFQIRFTQQGGAPVEDDGISIDSVRIHYLPDVGVVAIDSPASGCYLTASEPVKFRVYNYGARIDSGTWIPYSVWRGTGTSIVNKVCEDSFQLTAPMHRGDTVVVTAPSHCNVNLNAVASVPVRVKTEWIPDARTSNNAFTKEVIHFPTYNSFPHVETFEGIHYWETGGTHSSWAVDAPTAPTIDEAGEDLNALITNPSGSYNPNEYSWARSPCYDFSSLAADPIVSFLHAWEMGDSTDEAWLEYSTDAGRTWTRLTGGGVNWYTDTVQQAWRGDSGWAHWHVASHRLSGLAGIDSVQFRFVFRSDSADEGEGMAIDQFSVLPGGTKVYDPTARPATGSWNTSVLGLPGWIKYQIGGEDVIWLEPNNNLLGSTDFRFESDFPAAFFGAVGQYMTPRHWVVDPSIQPASPVTLRLFLTHQEWDSLRILDAHLAKGIQRLGITHYHGPNDGTLSWDDNNYVIGDTDFIAPDAITVLPWNNGYALEFDVVVMSQFGGNSGGGTLTPLPVEFAWFTAQRIGDDALLRWATATERNSAYFRIEVATEPVDGRLRFRTLDTIGARGKNGRGAEYAFVDDEPGKTGIRYYRIVEVAFDGTTTFSGVRKVDFGRGPALARVRPNPVKNELEITLPAAPDQTADIRIEDARGRLMWHDQTPLREEPTLYRVPVAEWPKGVYMMRIQIGEQIGFLKVVKR